MNVFDISDHPCFNREASGRVGRVHLAVAPACNIKCNYCDRRFDCPNEGRPGVTSRLLTPAAALAHLDAVMAGPVPISVAGIAGPGDPLANPAATFRTLERIRRKYPELLLCLSTNGLMALPFLPQIAGTISHITFTVNAVDAGIGARIYSHVKLGSQVYTGVEAAGLLLERQLEGIQVLKRAGLVVKVNTVVIPGVNDEHVPAIAARMKDLGVDIFNAMPLYPVAGTPFAGVTPPGAHQMRELRHRARAHLPQMTHCVRCRADAAGFIGQAQPEAVAPKPAVKCAAAGAINSTKERCIQA